MTSTLDKIKAPVDKELKEFENYFKDSMKSNVALLDTITYYIYKRKGKQVRPILVLLTAKMLGNISDDTYKAASLIELVHTATLVHDDVVDDSKIRRSFFSVNALWKNKVAVLVGDYLLAKGLQLSIDGNRIEFLRILSSAVKMMSEGELMQIQKARKLDITEDVYFEIIRQKTASLISSACAIGAASVTNDSNTIHKLSEYGEKIGIAFQIKDDLFDYGDDEIGKPRGIDIKEKKMTLPLIYTLQNSSKTEKSLIINTVKNHNEDPKKVKELIAMIKEKGGMDYAISKMEEYKQAANIILNSFPENNAKTSLLELSEYIINRNK
ncbi:MAG: polyprenyl synthetase family protein [Deltaproteobacteria bacterium]